MKSLNFVRSTKIVSTLGPATLDYNMIKSLMLSGVNVFRLNFSHGNHDNHQKTIEKIRSLEKELKFQIAILADLQGPKFRIGKVEKDVLLKVGEKFQFDKNKIVGDSYRVNLSHSQIYSSVKKDSIILLDDDRKDMSGLLNLSTGVGTVTI